MTIARRMLLLIGTGIVSLILLGCIGLFQINRVYEKTNYGNTNIVPSIQIISLAILEFSHIRVRLYRHVLSSDEKLQADLTQKIKEARSKLEGTLNAYEPLVADAEDQRLLKSEREALAAYSKGIEQVLEASRNGRKDEARELLIKYVSDAERLNESFIAHSKYNETLGKQGAEEGVRAKTTAVWTALSIFLATLVVLSALGLHTLKSLVGRIGHAKDLASRISNGDLSAGAGKQFRERDELGDLLEALEKMRSDLASTISEIVTQASSVAHSSGQLSVAASQVKHSSDNQSESTSSVAAALEELTVSIDHVSDSADDSRDHAKQAEENALASGEDVGRASTSISKVAERADQTAQEMLALSEKTKQIGRITTVIRDVADQTNLLALNAAIEAARAGEQGRGFAVVADEVRKLAERTSQSVSEITEMISSIQNGAITAVNSMQDNRDMVQDVVSVANRASQSMEEIRVAAATVQDSISAISIALREQRSAAADVSKNVEAIAQMSEENAAAISSVSDTARELVSISGNLKGCVSRFRL